jgi:hypothetical protein
MDEGDAVDLEDELWDGDFWEGLPESSLPLSAVAPIFGVAAGEEVAFALPPQRAFRCLDSSHTAGCDLCSPPPTAQEASRWELRGDPGCVRALRPRAGTVGAIGLRGEARRPRSAPAALERHDVSFCSLPALAGSATAKSGCVRC